MLIDADKYREFLNTYPLKKAQSNFMTFYRDALQQTFECEVKDVAEVVRCKDCIHYGDTIHDCQLNCFGVTEEFFCADGERRQK